MHEYEYEEERVTDESILDEAERLRRHTEELQRIANDRTVSLEKIKANDREHRRHILIGVLVGVGVLIVLAMCFGGCAYAVDKCSESGGVWNVDHCELPE